MRNIFPAVCQACETSNNCTYCIRIITEIDGSENRLTIIFRIRKTPKAGFQCVNHIAAAADVSFCKASETAKIPKPSVVGHFPGKLAFPFIEGMSFRQAFFYCLQGWLTSEQVHGNQRVDAASHLASWVGVGKARDMVCFLQNVFHGGDIVLPKVNGKGSNTHERTVAVVVLSAAAASKGRSALFIALNGRLGCYANIEGDSRGSKFCPS